MRVIDDQRTDFLLDFPDAEDRKAVGTDLLGSPERFIAMSVFSCVNGKWTCPTAPCQGLSEKGRIPLALAQEAYKEYAAQGLSSQTLERLNERGGFGADELAILLFQRIKRLEGNAPV
jgi:hypothetical protein